MKTTLIKFAAISGILFAYASPSFAATLNLTSGGLGQVAANPQQFGIAVCDNDTQALTAAVPLTVTVAGVSATISSADSIAVGQCAYSYLPYSQFNMQAGQTYSVNVDLNNNQTSYSVTVPAQPAPGVAVAAAATNGANLTADASANLSNPFSKIWSWFLGIFKAL